MRYTTERIVKLAILSSLGLVLMFFVRFPVIPTASFLEYEPGDVPALVASFLYGPSSGLLVRCFDALCGYGVHGVGRGYGVQKKSYVQGSLDGVVFGILYNDCVDDSHEFNLHFH
ncbi:MAG: riboflavin transporter, partial [Thermovirga sp.]|nr:riboflavin transporter [Thermovirga sp.]